MWLSQTGWESTLRCARPSPTKPCSMGPQCPCTLRHDTNNPYSLQYKQHPSKTVYRTAKAAGYLLVELTFCVTEEPLTQSILEKPTFMPTITARASFVPTATDATPIT